MNIGKINIGVVGNGFVGGAVSSGFRNKGCNVRVYDKQESLSDSSLKEVLACDFVFVCLPTPMAKNEGGPVDLSALGKFFEEVIKNKEYSPIYIIKSTVPPGTTESIRSSSGNIIKVVHNPEFLTSANAHEDFESAERTVIGGLEHVTSNVSLLYEKFYPYSEIIEMSSDESELVKYAANCFLATKVTYFNLIYKLCESLGLDYAKVIHGTVSDFRIADSHCDVPGPDGDFGFGGTCFPKDINGLIHSMYEANVSTGLLKEVWDLNKTIRSDWDWVNNSSAVSSNS
jgi:UDPglucose 6-dehydrogenase